MQGFRSNRRPQSHENTLLSRNNTTQIRPTIIVKSNYHSRVWLRTCQVFTIETTQGRAITPNQRSMSTGIWPSNQALSSWSLSRIFSSRMNWSTTMITWVVFRRMSKHSGDWTQPRIVGCLMKTELSRTQAPCQIWIRRRTLPRKSSMHLSLSSESTPLTQQWSMEVELSD